MTFTPSDWPGGLAYFVVFFAALIEGEVVFIAAATLAGQGSLNPVGVFAAGMLGAAAGDQIPFYLLRYHVRSWLDRVPAMRRVSGTLVRAVSRRRALLSFLIRFAPGLRLAIASACAYAEVPPLVFSTCSIAGAFVWATCIVVIVGWLGPHWLSKLGLSGWWAMLIPAAVVLIMLRTIAWARRIADENPGAIEPEPGEPER
ncbi:MAG TPA: VTT domain-containing protein [Vicinamibacterales bacterium]|jgi:membrane protein DedA with SNARE-associated domain